MIDAFRFPRFDREDFMDVPATGAMHWRCYNRSSPGVNAFTAKIACGKQTDLRRHRVHICN